MAPSGRFPLKTEATEIVDGIAHALGLLLGEYHVKFRVDPDAKTVAIIPVAPDTKNSMQVRRSTDDKTIVLYLHGVFKEYPMLRPSGKREVLVTRHSSGKAAVINLGGGLSLRTTPRDDSSSSETTQK